jgi:GNAT superfamily N-acetyltransferase
MRRRGIGKSLVQSAIAAAREEGIQTVEVASWSFNEETHQLLEQLGFTAKVIRFENLVLGGH